jgi:hypothetical protein
VEDSGLYRLDRDSVAAEDLPNIVAPTAGVGRWIRMSLPLSDHSLLSNLQGGSTGEYYHLTAAELAKVALVVDATTSNKGLVELATQPEVDGGTDAARAVTPATLAAHLAAKAATTTARGLVELSTDGENQTGTDGTRAVTPAGLKNYLDWRAATVTSTGVVELATAAETQAGADGTRAVTPAGLQSVIDNTLSTDFLDKTTYDPTTVGGDVFDADNIVVDAISGVTGTDVQAVRAELAGMGGVTPGGSAGDVQINDGAGGFGAGALNEDATGGTIQTKALDVTDADLDMGGGALLNYFDSFATLATSGTAAWDHATSKGAALSPSGAVTLSLTGTVPAGAMTVNTLVITDGDTNVTWPVGAIWIGTGGSAPTLQSSGTDIVTIMATSSAVYLFHAGSSN